MLDAIRTEMGACLGGGRTPPQQINIGINRGMLAELGNFFELSSRGGLRPAETNKPAYPKVANQSAPHSPPSTHFYSRFRAALAYRIARVMAWPET